MITRWNPMRDMMEMQDTIDGMYDDAWRPFHDNNLELDIHESDTAYTIEASVPGISPENLNITLHNNRLTISGVTEQNREATDNGSRVIMRERRVGKFSRSVRLAQPVNADDVTAEYDNGVLTLTLNKSQETTPGRVRVLAE